MIETSKVLEHGQRMLGQARFGDVFPELRGVAGGPFCILPRDEHELAEGHGVQESLHLASRETFGYVLVSHLSL